MSWRPPTEEEMKKIRISRLNKYCHVCATPLSKSNSRILVLRGEVEILNELAQSFYEELRDWRNNVGIEKGLTRFRRSNRLKRRPRGDSKATPPHRGSTQCNPRHRSAKDGDVCVTDSDYD